MSDIVSIFAKEMTIEQSSRSQILMLIGLFGLSGGGKTVTAIVAAIGLTSPDAKIGIVDTEQRRSGMAGDVALKMAKERYGRAPELVSIYLDPPFHPLKYVAAFRKLQEAGCKAIIADSMTHSWSGEGGYLDLKEEALQQMAGDDWKKREKCAMAAAARVKPATHAKLVDAVLHAKVPVILCFRGKEKTTIGKNEEGRTAPKRDEFATPIHEEGLIFEMLISGECGFGPDGQGGFCRFVGPGCKYTHPDLRNILPRPDEQFGFAHAEAIAKWCANPVAPTTATAPKPTDDKRTLQTELRTVTESIHGWKKGDPREKWENEGRHKLESWLLGQGIIGDAVTLADLSVERLGEVLAETKAALRGGNLL